MQVINLVLNAYQHCFHLQLDRPLPLETNAAMIRWIELQQTASYKNCYLAPQVNSNSSNAYPYFMKPNATTSDYWVCTQTDLPDEMLAQGKICLQYTTRNTFLCNVSLLLPPIECQPQLPQSFPFIRQPTLSCATALSVVQLWCAINAWPACCPRSIALSTLCFVRPAV